MLNLLVFDFDGTIVDSKKVIYRSVKKVLRKYIVKIPKDLPNKLGDKPLRKLLLEFGFSKENSIRIAKEVKLDYIENVSKIKAVKGLNSIRNIKIRKILLTNNSLEYVKAVLKNTGIDFFDEVHTGDYFENKIDEFNKIVRKGGFSKKEILYVGDKPIDVKVARKVGCKVVIMANKASWSTKSEIKRAKPDFILKDLREIAKIVL